MNSPNQQLARAMERLAGELCNVSSEKRLPYVETLVAFSKFAKACGFAPAWERLHHLAQWIDDLDRGRVAPTLAPSNTGRGTAPDSTVTWNDRVLVLVAFAMLQNAELGQQEAARYIAKKHPKLEGLMKRRKKLAATMLRWRRDLYDARPGDFLHRFGTQLVEHEDWLKQQHPTREQWILGADSMLARLSDRVSP